MFRSAASSALVAAAKARGLSSVSGAATCTMSIGSMRAGLLHSAAMHQNALAGCRWNVGSHSTLCATSNSFSTAASTAATTTLPPATTSPSASSPLDAFRDDVPRQQRMNEPVGRPWSVRELRRKSYDDLHKLWYVLYKEKNMLLTELQLSRRRGLIFPQPERMKKVQRSMASIRQVLGERKRVKIAAFREQRQQQEQQQSEEPAMNFHE